MKIDPVVSKICLGQIGPFILGPLVPGTHILHNSKSSSNELKKQISQESNGSFFCKIDKNLNFDLFSPFQGQKGPQNMAHVNHILPTSKMNRSEL